MIPLPLRGTAQDFLSAPDPALQESVHRAQGLVEWLWSLESVNYQATLDKLPLLNFSKIF